MVLTPSFKVPVIPPPELAQLAAAPPLLVLAAVTVNGVPFVQKAVAFVTAADTGPAREGSIVKVKVPFVPALHTPFRTPDTATADWIWPAYALLAAAMTNNVITDDNRFFFNALVLPCRYPEDALVCFDHA